MKTQNGKNDKGAPLGTNNAKAEKWKAPTGAGVPSSLEEIQKTLEVVKLGTPEEIKAGKGKPFPQGLIDRAKTAFKDSLKTKQGTTHNLRLGRDLWEAEIFAGLMSVNPDEERAETLTNAVMINFTGGKDYANAIAFLRKFETLPVKLQNYLTFCGTSKEEVLRLSELKEAEGGFIVSDNWLDLCVNCSGTFGNLKKFYTFNSETETWETVAENRERRKDEEEGEETPKKKAVAIELPELGEEEKF